MFKCRAFLTAACVISLSLSLAGAASVRADYGTETIRKVQEALLAAGYDCGSPDGKAGRKTSEAVSAYQNDHGMAADGVISEELLASLQIQAAEESGSEDAFAAAWGSFDENLYDGKWQKINDAYEFYVPLETDFGAMADGVTDGSPAENIQIHGDADGSLMSLSVYTIRDAQEKGIDPGEVYGFIDQASEEDLARASENGFIRGIHNGTELICMPSSENKDAFIVINLNPDTGFVLYVSGKVSDDENNPFPSEPVFRNMVLSIGENR